MGVFLRQLHLTEFMQTERKVNKNSYFVGILTIYFTFLQAIMGWFYSRFFLNTEDFK